MADPDDHCMLPATRLLPCPPVVRVSDEGRGVAAGVQGRVAHAGAPERRAAQPPVLLPVRAATGAAHARAAWPSMPAPFLPGVMFDF